MLERLVAYLVERLRQAGVGEGGLATSVGEAEAYVGADDRWVLRVVVQGPRVVLSAIEPSTGAWRDHPVDGLADLDACWPAVVESGRGALAQLTVHRLEKGRRYRIARDFRDAQGQAFTAGEELVFEERAYLPYHDGHTLRFAERSMWLAGASEEYARFGILVVPAEATAEEQPLV
jgi:hypothetical protein